MSQRPRRASLFITLFILERDNNNKNNRLDLNGSKGNINIPLLYYVLLTRGQPHSPPRRRLCTVYFLWGYIAGLKMIPVYESMRKNKRFLTPHPSSSKSVTLFLLYLLWGGYILSHWGVTKEHTAFSIQWACLLLIKTPGSVAGCFFSFSFFLWHKMICKGIIN